MKPEIKERYIAALESGEYKQMRGQLKGKLSTAPDGHAIDCFCALGVLCDLYSKEFNVPWEGTRFQGSGCGLSEEVAAWAGVVDVDSVSDFDINFQYQGDDSSVVNLNDGECFDFTAIAQILKEAL